MVRGRRGGLGGRVRKEEEKMLGREEIRRAIDRGKDNKGSGDRGFHQRSGNMRERNWKNEYEIYAIEFGKGRNG